MTLKHQYFHCIAIFLLLLFITPLTQAQAVLTGLSENTTLIKLAKSYKDRKTTDSVTAVTLPFFDDFSDYIGYPNPELWADRQGFVNNSYPIRPPSIGAVTLDALDENGKIYSHASSSLFAADKLTSLPIRLDSIFSPSKRPIAIRDSLYFSFYYQPGGGCGNAFPCEPWERIGNKPEYGDKLVLDFGYYTGDSIFVDYKYINDTVTETYAPGDSIPNPYMLGTYYYFLDYTYPGTVIQLPCDSLFEREEIWNEVWSTNGVSLDEWLKEDPLNYFKQVLIPILDEKYLRNNFQFRFRNFASLDIDENTSQQGEASNVDQWHIDYVRLDINRSHTDLYPTDITFVAPTSSFLNDYYAMPWNQFQASDMKSKLENQLANISPIIQNTRYSYTITKNDETTPYFSFPSSSFNANPYYPNGLHTYSYHANPDFNPTITYDGKDSALFKVTHIFELEGYSGDIRRQNDTFSFEQKFYNYYAYDDGTAENGLILISSPTVLNASLAIQFTLTKADTLRSIRMWFNRVLKDANLERGFSLMVWNDDNGVPGEMIYSQEVETPVHAEQYLDFVDYHLEEPLLVSGTFYVGFHQNHNVHLNIGFDQNNDARSHYFTKTSSNRWNREPYLRGAPMIRPVLGKRIPGGVNVPEIAKTIKVLVYPNPTQGVVRLSSSDYSVDISKALIYDVYGKLMLTKEIFSANETIDISSFTPGIYFIRLYEKEKYITTSKVIKL